MEVTLIELKATDEDTVYKADLKSTWAETLSAVHLVDAEYDADANVYYYLLTPVRSERYWSFWNEISVSKAS